MILILKFFNNENISTLIMMVEVTAEYSRGQEVIMKMDNIGMGKPTLSTCHH